MSSNDYIETQCNWSCKAEIAQLKAQLEDERSAVHRMSLEQQKIKETLADCTKQIAAAEAKIERVHKALAEHDWCGSDCSVMEDIIEALSDTEAQ